ncbi:hypothetical protein SLE2022_255300 [Rubroshorea leprosula]
MESARVRGSGAATREDGYSRRRQGQHRWQGHQRRFERSGFRFSGQATAFFFYNFPETAQEADLWRAFQRYGRVIDVYVPEKRDKWGKRFGFVRMMGVRDVSQMVRRLNQIWIGLYKLRVRVAEDRVQRTSGTQRKTIAEHGTMNNRLHRFVQPDQSYAQVVAGNFPELKRAAIGSQKDEDNEDGQMIQQSGLRPEVNEEGSSCDKQVTKQQDQPGNEIIEFSPKIEELQWLEGSMIAVVRSLDLVTGIQARMDVDGGLIILAPLGGRRMLLLERTAGYLDEYMRQNKGLFETWFESICPWETAPEQNGRLVWLRISGVPLKAWCDGCFEKIAASIGEVIIIHDDTKKKSILCDGRVMILCYQSSKIAKSVMLKVEEQLYEINVAEEEWRLDPDWWLSTGDRSNSSVTESEYSSSEYHDEDLELINTEISGEEADSIDEALSTDVGYLNLHGNHVTEGDVSYERGCQRGVVRGGVIGPKKVAVDGPVADQKEGRGADVGLENSGSQERIMGMEGKESKSINAEKSHSDRESGSKGVQIKRRRNLEECYPQSLAAVSTTKTQWVTGRTKKRQGRRKKAQHNAEEKAKWVGSSSLSDGCIEHRNQVIKRDLDLIEVRRMISVGKRLGINFQDSEEEVQSRLLAVEGRIAVQGR